jgi:hypothetical protein
VKTALKGRQYQDAKDIKRNITTNLNAIPLGTFHDCFVQFTGRCKKHIAVKEDYFESK